jgi:uncharacterized membrane protein YoaK (UPF0700 family)
VVAGARTTRSLWPWAGSGFGSLPLLLVVMTVVTGIVDAVSYLALGHVFVANMTGNVVFLGFALAGAGGLAMGVQNAMARSLAVPDLTTTVLTLTLTGVAADSTGGTGSGGHIGRRLISVGAMFGGALAGALLVIHVDIALPLAIAAALLVATRVLAQVLSPV